MGNTQQITVFTPTYNREKLLWRVFESLQKQTDNNFRWLIVDDGSCDATGKAVALMMEKSAFNIEYIYQENGGKHRAHNTAVRKCQTEYMLILDSDDYLTKDAISVLYSKIKLIQTNSTKNMDCRVIRFGFIKRISLRNICSRKYRMKSLSLKMSSLTRLTENTSYWQ